MAPLKRHALPRRHEVPHIAARSSWPRRNGRDHAIPITGDSQVLRGLLVGLPLGTAIWLLLAGAVWWIA